MQGYGMNTRNLQREGRNIIQRIMTNGGYPNVAAVKRAIDPFVAKYNRLNKALTRNRNLGREIQVARWPKVQEAAGKFKVLRNVAGMRRTPSPTSHRVISEAGVHTIANFLRPIMLGRSVPVTTTYQRYLAGPPRPRAPRAPRANSAGASGSGSTRSAAASTARNERAKRRR